MAWAFCTALMTGLPMLNVMPDCLNFCSVVLLEVSRSSMMSTFLAVMLMSPVGATMS
jgi:hypothetical protein